MRPVSHEEWAVKHLLFEAAEGMPWSRSGSRRPRAWVNARPPSVVSHGRHRDVEAVGDLPMRQSLPAQALSLQGTVSAAQTSCSWAGGHASQ